VSEMALALLTTMSMPPKCPAVRAIASLTASSSRTSTVSASARPPASSISAAAVWMVPGSLGWGVSVFAAIATLAPWRAARSATASPMPREAPVMKRVLPFRDMWGSGAVFQSPPEAGVRKRRPHPNERPHPEEPCVAGRLEGWQRILTLQSILRDGASRLLRMRYRAGAPRSHVEPVERFFLLDRLQAIEQRHHLVAPEPL